VRTISVVAVVDQLVKTGANVEIGVDSCSTLRAYLTGVAEWRITSASAEYVGLNPQAVGLVAMSLFPDSWSGEDNFSNLVATGGIQFSAASPRRRTPAISMSSEWVGAGKTFGAVVWGVRGTTGDVGSVTLHLVVQVRGVSVSTA